MRKDAKLNELRKGFIRQSFNNPRLAANQLRTIATGLENCRTAKDINYALQHILFLSERTIYGEYCKD